MNETFLILLVSCICLAVGTFAGSLFTRLKIKSETSKLEAQLEQSLQQEARLIKQSEIISSDREEIRGQKEHLNQELTKKISEFDNLQQKLKDQKEDIEKLQEKFTKDFEILANNILENKSKKFTESNKESIDGILKPLQIKIESFEKKVEDSHKESIARHATLHQQIIGLTTLNEQMTKEATNLTKALKGDSKTQGNWGELVLERVLEKSGLEKDREYTVQSSFMNEGGRRILPDVVVNLPDNKKMIIDSKVSLAAYERFVNEDDKNEQAKYLKEHIASLKRHIDQLSEKKYQDIYEIESPDFVLLFIPIEPAFAVAINQDNGLYNWAFEKNIVIVTPTTLLATLRTIDSMWNNEKQQKNAIEIATQAGRLYDQFVNLTEDLLKVGNQLNTVKGSYDSTMIKLTGKGNLISRIENLKKLGSKASKQLNENLLKKTEENEDPDLIEN